MPRVEIVPAGWETSEAKRQGDGTPTIDICPQCFDADEGDEIPENLEVLQILYPNGMIGSTDVAHPSYEDDRYTCWQCGRRLKEGD